MRGDKNIANGFNNFFVDIGPALANNIPKTGDVFAQYLSVNVNDTMFIEPVTEEEIQLHLQCRKQCTHCNG